MIIYKGRKIRYHDAGYSVTLPGGEFLFSPSLTILKEALDWEDARCEE